MRPRESAISGPIVLGQLFAWYHAPARPWRDGGVVLCNPFGYEAMCLHRCYRILAERIAAAGMPVLRFDYHGTGDSAGSDRDPERVEAWIASVRAAAAELRRRGDVARVSLFGVRFGGTLAALAALKGEEIDGIVLWSPYITGRSFLREMRMMQSAGAEQAFAAAADRGESPAMKKTASTDEEAIGYVLTPSTVADLSRIDLRAIKAAPARRVLLLGRDDLPDDGRYRKHLATHGADVTDLTGVPGYAAMMQDAYLSKVPDEAFGRVVEWLRACCDELPPTSLEPPATVPDLSRAGPKLSVDTPHSPASIREESLMFGEGGGLFGVLTEPAERSAAHEKEAVLFLNVGSNHRVGSNRMYVSMARELAARGMTSLRFDVSGLGDSTALAQVQNRLYAKEAVLDVRAAIDALASLREKQRFFLVGLCSGAYLAFKTSHVEPRVAGQILINTQTFEWKEGDTLEVSMRKNYRSTRFYTTEVWNPQVWARVLRGEVNAKGIAQTLASRALERVKRGAQGTVSRIRHGRLETDDVAADFKDILRRGTSTLLVFGANDGGLDLMESHLGHDAKKLEKFRNFKLEIVDGSDHTFTPVWSQVWLEKLVVETIERWRGATIEDVAALQERFSQRALRAAASR